MRAQKLIAAFFALVSLSSSAQPATPDPPKDQPLAPELQAGKAVYEQHCAACHGVKGDGSGPASVWLFPRPRNFSAGLFKIKSTPGTALPTDEDLLSTVTRGMPGSSMPSFTYLTEGERRSAVQYVKYLTAYTDASGKRVNRFEEARKSNEARRAYLSPARAAGDRAVAGRRRPAVLEAELRDVSRRDRRRRRPERSDPQGHPGPVPAAARFQHRRLSRRPHRPRFVHADRDRSGGNPDGGVRQQSHDRPRALVAGALHPITPPQGR